MKKLEILNTNNKRMSLLRVFTYPSESHRPTTQYCTTTYDLQSSSSPPTLGSDQWLAHSFRKGLLIAEWNALGSAGISHRVITVWGGDN